MALRMFHRSPSANRFLNGYSLIPRCSRSLPDRFFDHPNAWISNVERSYFTATQAAAALRPFYFAVHPDLFGLYPDMYRTNEQSLKALNGYIDALYAAQSTSTKTSKPVSLKFYVRHRKQQKAEKPLIKSVQVNLKENDPCAAVRSILESCELSTEHLPPPVRLPWRSGGVGDMARPSVKYETTVERAFDDTEIMRFWASKKKTRPPVEFMSGLREWLTKMTPHARNLRSQQEQLEVDMKRKMDEIKNETGLTRIDFNLSWTLTHCRGCLQLFRKALSTSGIPTVNLRGWILKFGRRGSYVSLDRSIVLGVDDLPAEWINLINNLNPPHAYYGDLPVLEKKLNQRLAGASVVVPSDTPIREYKSRLVRLNDRLSNNQIWIQSVADQDWSKLRLIIENEACGLMLLESGDISVPYSIHPETLYEFLVENHEAAINLTQTFETIRGELKSLRDQCIERWNLETIDWGDTYDVSHHAIKTCLERLSVVAKDDREEVEMKNLLRGHRLHIGPQENCIVLPDGRLSIPCDWKL